MFEWNSQELTQQLEKIKEKEEREKRKIIAEEKHKEWVQKKNEQVRGKIALIHPDISFAKYSSCDSSLPRFFLFSLRFFLFWPDFFFPTSFSYPYEVSVLCPLLFASLPFLTCGLQVITKSVPLHLTSWGLGFPTYGWFHLWAYKSKQLIFAPSPWIEPFS